MRLLPACAGLLLGIAPLACAEEPPAPAAAEHAAAEERTVAERRAEGLELFERRIRPLLAAKCYACHGPEEQENELRLDTHEGLLAGGVSGASLVPHKPAASLLITAVRYDDAALQMPPDRRLSAAEVAALTRWVELGMPHPEARDGEPAPAQRGPEGGAQGSEHWAFQPLADGEIPAGDSAAAPIDRFLVAELRRAGLEPAPPAEKHLLLRRATFDLTGLPPTEEELAAFLADESPEAFARVVDRLLASPHYGERWGRHWLDLARYADSNGLDENVAHGNAWRYRDYVIAAFNGDKPYNRFLQEQLAGDLLPAPHPNERNEQLIATGFLVLGPKVLAEVDKGKLQADIIDEQIDTFGKAVLGLTLGCARCHDHKFDPISQRDYYALAGVFRSTRTMETFKTVARWHENQLASEEFERARAAHQEQTAALRARIESRSAEAREALEAEPAETPTTETPPAELEARFPPEAQQELKQLREELAALEKKAPEPPTAMGVAEGEIGDAPLHPRGNHLTIGEQVPRGLPAVLTGEAPVKIGPEESGRRQLAEWLTGPGSPLTARVMVNRVWRWHFGRGLVETPDNFGRLGSPPSHPALLDWLALRFVEQGWSLKRLHREMMLTAAYQRSSRPDPLAQRRDPGNRLLSWFPLRRLEAEELRDAWLAVSGRLDRRAGGSLLNVENRGYLFNHTSRDGTEYGARRRSVYLPVVRNNRYDVCTLFDYTDASVSNGDRSESTIPSQALYLLNSEMLAEAAEGLAEELLAAAPGDEPLALLHRRLLCREPEPAELERARAYLERFEERFAAAGDAAPRRGAWRALAHTLLISNEFLYVR